MSALPVSPLHVSEAASSADVDAAREALSSRHIDLTASPPFRMALVRDEHGSRVMLSVNHSAFDDVRALRLLQSVSRAYDGAP